MTRKSLYNVISAVAFILLMASVFLFYRSLDEYKRDTVRVAGTVTGKRVINTKGSPVFHVEYAYVLEDRSHAGKGWLDQKTYDRYRSGDKIPLLVKKADPASSAPAEGEVQRVASMLYFCAALVCFVVFLGFLISAKYEKPAKDR